MALKDFQLVSALGAGNDGSAWLASAPSHLPGGSPRGT